MKPDTTPKTQQPTLEVIEVTHKMKMKDGYAQSDALVIRQKGIDHMNLATIHPWGNPKAFAERIVKAVNMHDELINTLVGVEKLFTDLMIEGAPLDSSLKKIKQLLKQAEQK